MRRSRERFDEFRARWGRGRAGGVAGLAVRRPAWRHLRSYLRWLRPFAGRIVLVLVLGLCAAGLSLILPRATMYIVDVVLPQRNSHLLHLLGIGLLGVVLVQQVFDFLRNWNTARLNARILVRLRKQLYGHLLRLPLHKLAQMRTGGITSRLSGDIDATSGLVQMALLTPGVAAVKVAMTIAILFAINWRMAVGALMLLPLLIGLNLFYIRRIRPIYRSIRRDRAEIDARVVETFGGIRVVRAFGRERTELRRYATEHHAVVRKQLLARWLEFLVWAGWGLFIPLVALVIVWFGGTLVLVGKATIGGIIAFQMYLMMLLMPVATIVRSYGETQQSLASLERVFDLLAEPVDLPDRPGAVEAPMRIARIEFDGVSFAYPDRGPVLHEISLVVPGGTMVALVGPSGSGKTTLTHLVARFYDPTSGAIRLNGIDLRDIRLASYRRRIGLVQQDTFLFDGTIAENIAYARPDATRAEVIEAARRAHVHEFVEKLPAGYDTRVGERGLKLSGGQAQRVAIARAILADPQILILDEATSNLDSESERCIQQSLARLLEGRTTFVIAHRLSTVVGADMIVVLDRGRLIEVGTHHELIVRNGRYRQMVEQQFSPGACTGAT